MLGFLGLSGLVTGALWKWVAIGALTLLIATSAALWWQNGRIEALNDDKAVLEANVAVSEGALAEERATLAGLQEDYQRQADKLGLLYETNQGLIRERDDAITRLEAARGTLHQKWIEDPDSTDADARNDTRRVLDELSTASSPGGGRPDDTAD